MAYRSKDLIDTVRIAYQNIKRNLFIGADT